MKHKLRFKLDRETKGTYVYKEVNEAGEIEGAFHVVGSIYVRKTAVGKGVPAPETLTVIVAD